MADKSVVHYKADEPSIIVKGHNAMVYTLDHPTCSNKGAVLTSTVLEQDYKTGEFETENHFYKPAHRIM